MSDEIKYGLDFYYGKESEQFSFYRIPKLLFTDERFKNVSSDAKLLYGLMLNRMSLSIINGWFDDENRAYIYFTLEEVMEYLSVGKDKGIKLFAELDDEKGCGLIKKKRQGLGKPMIIYVMNFSSSKLNEEDETAEKYEDFLTPEKSNSETSENAEVQTSEKPKSGILEIRSPDICKTEANKIEINNNKINKTDVSYNNPMCTEYDFLLSVSEEFTEKRSKLKPLFLSVKSKYRDGEVMVNIKISNLFAVRSPFVDTDDSIASVRAYIDTTDALIEYVNYQNYRGNTK